MSKVRLLCGVYGEGSLFPVTIARDAEVYDLQEAIVTKKKDVNPRFSIDPSLLKLYLAKKNGAWVKDDDYLEELLQGEVDKTYPRMRSSWKLNKAAYFGPQFKPQEEDIHVLVELPPVAALARPKPLLVGMNSDAEKLIAPYEKVADRLKIAPEVSQLVDAVRYVARNKTACPFIVLENSSGMGKTQMAFNLMARDDIEVYYIVCESGPGLEQRQAVYTAFDGRSSAFLECIQSDMQPEYLKSLPSPPDGLAHGERLKEPVGLRLHTFEFIRALLSGAKTMEKTPCSYGDVKALLLALNPDEQPKKQHVVFLDEFPLLGSDNENVRKLRFMRNVFRTLELPVIISSTNGTARNMVVTGNTASRGENNVPWCVVVPRMVGFQDPDREAQLRDDMKVLVQRSRPLFAQLTLEYMEKHWFPSPPNDDLQVIEFMNALTRELAQQCRQWKEASSAWKSSEWFRLGQVCLFLSAHHYESAAESGHLIQGHFAWLQDAEMFELRFGGNSKLVKWGLEECHGTLIAMKPQDLSTLWNVRTVFPPIDEDILMYLSLLGGKCHRAFKGAVNKDVSFYAALREIESGESNPLHFGNPGQPSNDGMRLEAITAAAIMSASHCDGFAGIRLDKFLAEMAFDLGMGHPAATEKRAEKEDEKKKWCLAIPAPFDSLVMPFLAPPDTTWPTELPNALNLGAIVRTPNADRIDLRVGNGWFTGECKDYVDALDLGAMKEILKRVPRNVIGKTKKTNTTKTTKAEKTENTENTENTETETANEETVLRVHVVVTNKLQDTYTRQAMVSLQTFLSTKCSHLKKTLFLQYGMTGRVVGPIKGLTRDVAKPDRLVLFVAREPLVAEEKALRQRGSSVSTSAADTMEAASGRAQGKRPQRKKPRVDSTAKKSV